MLLVAKCNSNGFLRLQAKMQMVNRNMVGIVSALDRALATNNLEKVRSHQHACTVLLSAVAQPFGIHIRPAPAVGVGANMPMHKKSRSS